MLRCLRIAFSLASVFWACALRIWISPSNCSARLILFEADRSKRRVTGAGLVVDDGVRAAFELRLGYRRHLRRGDEALRGGVLRHLYAVGEQLNLASAREDEPPAKFLIFFWLDKYDGFGSEPAPTVSRG